MVETREQEEKRRKIEARSQAEQAETSPKTETGEASSRSPQSSDSESDSDIYRQFCKFMKRFNKEQERKAKSKAKKGKKVKVSTSSSGSSSTPASSDSESEDEKKVKGRRYKKISDPIADKIEEVEKKLNEFQLKSKKKRSFTCEDFCDSFREDKHIKNLPKKFIKFDGLGDPKAHLAIFFVECSQFRSNHRALFRCFPRSLEGLTARWYREHINPIELKDFDKLINLFIERFISNVEITPTITTLCNMKQKQGENVMDFIQRWRSACNRMKEPISQSHALGLIVNNLSQPLRSLIFSAPVKSFIDLAERAECIEIGMENGAFDAVIKKPAGKPAHSVVASMMPSVKSKQTKTHGRKATAASVSKPNTAAKKLRPGWSYDRKFTPLEQSLEEIMEVLLQQGTLSLPKVSDPPPVMGKNNDHFCKFHRTPGHHTENCFVLKNIIQDAVDKELLNQKASSSGVLKNPFPAHGEGQASVSLIEVVAPIDAKPLDFFSLFSGQNTPEQNGSSNSSSSQDDLENIIPRAFFEPLEEILPPLMDSPPRPTFKVNTSLPFRIKQERFEPEDIWNVGWYACQPIIFTDEDLPAGGMHTNALHLRVSIKGVNICKVLVDGGASVNVCPLRTIQEIGIQRNQIEPSIIDITGFDGHSQTPLVKIILPLSIILQDMDHMVEFHVIDVDTSYNMLLRRPWIHSQNAVASTLHQMVRWSKGKTVFTAYAEDRQARPIWPHLPSPAYDIDVPMVHMMDISKLEQQMAQLIISKASSTPILDGVNRLRRELKKNPRGFHLLLCAGYQPYKGLGKSD
ncbi:unnamed protein product [Victoria cruziana]